MKALAPFILLTLALAGGVATWSGPPAGPPAGAEATAWLAAASLAFDRDFRLAPEDERRYREVWGIAPERVRLAGAESERRFDAQALPALVAAPLVRVAPKAGIAWAHWLWLALAGAASAQALGRRGGPLAGAAVAVYVIASAALPALFRFGPGAFLLATTVLAFALLRGGEPRAASELAEIYDGLEARTSYARLLRFGAVGLLLGVGGAADPLLLLLLVAAWLEIEPGRRRGAALALATGAAVALLAAAGLGGAPWIAPQPILDASLVGWNLLDFAAGGRVGLILWFVPLLSIAWLVSAHAARRALLLIVAAIALGRIVLYPYDWAGSAAGPAALAFLPLYGALWFATAGPLRVGPLVASLLLGGALLWPVWLSPRAAPGDLAAVNRLAAPLLARLPLETALRELPESAEVATQGVRLRTLDRSLWPTSASHLQLRGGEFARLVVASPKRLAAIRLEFDERAPSEIEVRGGSAGNTLFRPRGEVAFDLLLERPNRRHPTAWSEEPVSFYRLAIRLPKAPATPLGLRLTQARPLVPG